MTYHFKRPTLIYYTALLGAGIAVLTAFLMFSKQTADVYVDLVPSPPATTREATLIAAAVRSVRPGDAAYNWIGQKTVEVTGIDMSHLTSTTDSVISLKIRAQFDPRTHQYTYGPNPLLVGNSFSLNTGKTVLDGEIVNVYTSASDRYRGLTSKEADVTVFWRKLEDWQAQRFISLQNDPENKGGAMEITGVTIAPAAVDVPSAGGILYKGESALYKDVTLLLHIKRVVCTQSECFFNSHMPLSVGSEFTVPFIDKAFDKEIHKGFITSVVVDK